MAAYDSDSSSDDDLDVQTNVTLGYASKDPTGDDVSHVGGLPTWLDENTKPSSALARCKVCNSYMTLLLQLQADLQQQFQGDERRLFIWCCKKKQCSKKAGSVRTFREVKKAKTSRKSPAKREDAPVPTSSQPLADLGSQLFGGSTAGASSNTNPFSTPTSSSTSANLFSSSSQANGLSLSDLAAKSPQPPTQSFADKLKITSPSTSDRSQPQPPKEEPIPDPWPSPTSFPTSYPHFYLDAEPEYLEPAPFPSAGPSNTNSRITDLEDDSSTTTSKGGPSSEKDLFESDHDKTFDHFTRVLAANPEQVLRYEHGGTPLLYSSSDAVATCFTMPGHQLHAKVKTSGPVKGIPRCQSCGAARVFECQVTPYLIYELEKDDESAMSLDGGEGMEWGTILVGTCSRNCGDDDSAKVAFREEWTGVQWEEGGIDLKQRK